MGPSRDPSAARSGRSPDRSRVVPVSPASGTGERELESPGRARSRRPEPGSRAASEEGVDRRTDARRRPGRHRPERAREDGPRARVAAGRDAADRVDRAPIERLRRRAGRRARPACAAPSNLPDRRPRPTVEGGVTSPGTSVVAGPAEKEISGAANVPARGAGRRQFGRGRWRTRTHGPGERARPLERGEDGGRWIRGRRVRIRPSGRRRRGSRRARARKRAVPWLPIPADDLDGPAGARPCDAGRSATCRGPAGSGVNGIAGTDAPLDGSREAEPARARKRARGGRRRGPAPAPPAAGGRGRRGSIRTRPVPLARRPALARCRPHPHPDGSRRGPAAGPWHPSGHRAARGVRRSRARRGPAG